MKQKYSRENAILTGEQTPNIGESGTARIIISEIKSGEINFDVMTILQKNAKDGHYIGLTRAYIEWIQKIFLDENEELFTEILKNDFESARNDFYKTLKFSFHPRIPSMLAFLKIGFKHYSEISVLDKPTAKFINTLKDVIAGGAVRVEEIDILPDPSEVYKLLIGYQDRNILLFHTKCYL